MLLSREAGFLLHRILFMQAGPSVAVEQIFLLCYCNRKVNIMLETFKIYTYKKDFQKIK